MIALSNVFLLHTSQLDPVNHRLTQSALAVFFHTLSLDAMTIKPYVKLVAYL